jgi:hypothetical protein
VAIESSRADWNQAESEIEAATRSNRRRNLASRVKTIDRIRFLIQSRHHSAYRENSMAPRNSLGSWEVALVKAFIQYTDLNDQEILPYFSRPGRSINHRVIGEIRSESHFGNIEIATEEQLRLFRARWFSYSVKTGKQREVEEHVIKAREAQIAAVQIFNNPMINFRTEIFIVLTVIAWTYLLHAFYRKCGVDFRYYRIVDGKRTPTLTEDGLDCYWELTSCLDCERCPLPSAVKENLRFLIKIRNAIAHRLTGHIDLKIASKLQASALNFNTWLADEFGAEYRIDSDFGVAIQMSSFSHDQAKLLYSGQTVDPKITSLLDKFVSAVPKEILSDTKFAMNVLFVEQSANRPGQADKVVQFVRAGTEAAEEIERVVFKERERPKYKPAQIVLEMRRRGFKWFNMAIHTNLWQKFDAKNPQNGYGVLLADSQWYYYENWIVKVKEYCEETQKDFSAGRSIQVGGQE